MNTIFYEAQANTKEAPDFRRTSEEEVRRFPSRLKEAVGKESVRGFARRAGVSPSVVHNYLEGKSEPTRPILLSMAQAAGVNPLWLATGEGTMRRGQGRETEGQEGAGRDDDLYAYIPLYNVEASGGPGAIPGREEVIDWLGFKREWIKRELLAAISDLVLVFMTGDSMEPTLSKGDILLIDKGRARVMNDGIYLFRQGEALKVKRLQFLSGGRIKIISDNPTYGPETIDPEKEHGFSIKGRVVWCGRKM